MLRTPLERANGSLRVADETYDETLTQLALASERLGSNARLALYNRQYWFRLFTLFQGAFPLTTRLLSHFTFNGYVSGFLTARPPRHWDSAAGWHDANRGSARFRRHAGGARSGAHR